MHRHHDSEESCRSASVVLRIAAGESWTARKIQNNSLRQHCRLLARNLRADTTKTTPSSLGELLEAVVSRTELFTAHHPTEFPLIPVLMRIAAYSDRWIRDPRTWSPGDSKNPRMLIRKLLHHLFARWPVPEFFDSAWLIKGELVHSERDWYCHLANGGSLRKVQGMPPSISSKALHLAMNAPSHLTIRQGLRWGQLKALDASDELISEVLCSRMVQDLSNDAVWSRLFRKFVGAEGIAPEEFGIVADTLLEHISQEEEKKADTLVGLPLSALISYSRKFWQTMMQSLTVEGARLRKSEVSNSHVRHHFRTLANAKWLPFLGNYMPDLTGRSGKRGYFHGLVELTQHTHLIEEGQTMRHCVGSYVKRCRQGSSAIFSLRRYKTEDAVVEMERCATIEVRIKSRKIIQVKGKRNQLLRVPQIPPLRIWAHKNGLTF